MRQIFATSFVEGKVGTNGAQPGGDTVCTRCGSAEILVSFGSSSSGYGSTGCLFCFGSHIVSVEFFSRILKICVTDLQPWL
jgi:hypothetical protein